MPIAVTCEQCGKKYRVRDDLFGKKFRCKKCGEPVQIPVQGRVYRHTERERGFEFAIGGEDLELLTSHLEQHLGPIETVLHEVISDLVHVDLHILLPQADRDYTILATTGMSDRPMSVPEEGKSLQYAELLLCLPADWPLEQEQFTDEKYYWPIRWLKMLARFPHEYQTWLGSGHTIPNGDPAEPFHESVPFVCWLLLNPPFGPEALTPCEISEEKQVHFYALMPLYEEEMIYKLAHGYDALLERFDKYQTSFVLDPTRRNVCKRKG